MLNREDIGMRICYHRKINKITQEELAFRTNLSRVHIGYLKRGERTPSLESIVTIANALNVSADDILAGNLFVSETRISDDEIDILEDCSEEEMEILLRTMRSLRETIREYRITK